MAGWNMEDKKGGYLFKPEKATGDTKEFTYEILPVQKNNSSQSFDDWFDDAIDIDLQQSGFSLPESRKNITSNQTIASYSSEVTDKAGKSFFVTYISYQTSNHRYQMARVISSPDVKYYALYMRPVAAHFGTLAKQDGAQGKAEQAAQDNTQTSSVIDNGVEKGLKSSDINGILIHLEYFNSPDGKMVRVYIPYMVLNDGSIFSEPVLSPYNFEVSQSKLKEPKKWGTWKLKGNSFNVEWTGRNESEKWYKNWFWATPSAANEKIEGTYITATGKDNEILKGNEKGSVSNTITFNASGQFTIADNSNGPVTAADFSKRNEGGTYSLNDYSIELRFNNGTVVRRAFYFYLQGKTHFGIGNAVYVPKGAD